MSGEFSPADCTCSSIPSTPGGALLHSATYANAHTPCAPTSGNTMRTLCTLEAHWTECAHPVCMYGHMRVCNLLHVCVCVCHDLCRFPVNLLFVAMIGSSFFALQLVGVGMVTVWKNLSNFVTAMGDVFIFKKSYPWPVWLTLCMMLVSAVVGASTDSRFTWLGYGWQLANCLFTSAYALYLRSVMDKVGWVTHTHTRTHTHTCVLAPCANQVLYLRPL